MFSSVESVKLPSRVLVLVLVASSAFFLDGSKRCRSGASNDFHGHH